MILRAKEFPRIENVRNHSAEVVERLRELLTEGASALADPHRKDFYEVENHERVFYIHLCPDKSVMLLATWTKEPQVARASRASFAAEVHC